jgi:hypothetical protein
VPPGRLSRLTGHALEPRVQQNDMYAGDAARDRQSTRDQLLRWRRSARRRGADARAPD